MLTTYQLTVLVCVLIAAFVQGVTGFGFGMVVMALLPLFGSARESSILIGILGFATAASVLTSVFRSFRWRDFIYPIAGMVAGVPLGIYVLVNLPEELIRKLIGVVILVACLQMMNSQVRLSWLKAKPLALSAGFLSGILGGAFGMSGPPIIAYASVQDWDAKRYKAMLCSYFAVVTGYRLVILIGTGLITSSIALQAGMALPALFLGVWLGVRTFGRLSREGFRKAVIVTLAFLAFTLLVL